MHMISKKNLNSAEMDTLTKSCSPTTELEKFLTIKVLENTPAVLSIGKLCDENGYSYEWIKERSKTTSHKKRYSKTM